MKIERLDPPLPLKTPLGLAKAHLYIDRGRDEYGEWVCFLDRDGTSWTFVDPDIRMSATPTDNRFETAPFRNQKAWEKLYTRVVSACEAVPKPELRLAHARAPDKG